MGRFQAALALRERRGARRYGLEVQAWITVDAQTAPKRCRIHDISQTGALIEVGDGETLDEFVLTFSRRCRVVRHSEDGSRIGVEFLLPGAPDR